MYKIIEEYIRLLQCETTEFENNINQNLIGRISEYNWSIGKQDSDYYNLIISPIDRC